MFREMYIATGHKRGLCIEEISQRTGLSRKSVSYSAQLLSLREKPVLKMFAWVEKTKIGTKKFQTCFILR
jgi:DNA-binding transcriptional regulator GbsR (MarR family)